MPIRVPTSAEQMMAWHSNALLGDLGDDLPRHNDVPHCGWFKTRLVKKGPFVPARIWLDQDICPETGELCSDERFRCEIDGQERDAEEHWPFLSANPITQAEFDYLTATRAWAESHAPDEPAANPRKPVDWRNVPTGKLF